MKSSELFNEPLLPIEEKPNISNKKQLQLLQYVSKNIFKRKPSVKIFPTNIDLTENENTTYQDSQGAIIEDHPSKKTLNALGSLFVYQKKCDYRKGIKRKDRDNLKLPTNLSDFRTKGGLRGYKEEASKGAIFRNSKSSFLGNLYNNQSTVNHGYKKTISAISEDKSCEKSIDDCNEITPMSRSKISLAQLDSQHVSVIKNLPKSVTIKNLPKKLNCVSQEHAENQ